VMSLERLGWCVGICSVDLSEYGFNLGKGS
jgi:hypothetical protein